MSLGAPALVRYRQPQGRWVLLATILGSSIAFLDTTVVVIALPHIGRELGAGTAALQWTVNGYTLTLAGLILLAGSLGDRLGRRRIFVIGAAWFAIASALCGLAPTTEALVAGRILQGIGGALLTPGSLAIIHSVFVTEDRSRAIGLWAGFSGLSGVIGPFLGGWLVQEFGWRWIFLINLPLCAAVIAVALRHVPESRDETADSRHLDLRGAVVGVIGLAGLTYALTAWQGRGLGDPVVLGSLALGLAGLAGFVLLERSGRHPMMPLGVFRVRAFSATQVETFFNYAALAGFSFFLTVTLQVVSGYSPLAAGLAGVPITAMFLLLSSRAGALAERIGPRLPMGIGPLVCAVGAAMVSQVGEEAPYLTSVLPGILVLGAGLVIFVAPLTSTALDAAPDRHAGLASGVNNAVARAAALIAVAALPLIAGTGPDLNDPAALGPAHEVAMLVCAGLMAAGGVIGLVFIPGSADEVRRSAREAG